MTPPAEPTAHRPPCARGCILRDQHEPTCEDRDRCRGCIPRRASNGLLCFPCHRRLLETLLAAPVQHDMLLAVSGLAAPRRMRGDADLIRGKHTQTPPPLRLACIDEARYLADLLSEFVERLVDDYRMRGPKQHISNADRHDPRRRVAITRGERDGYRWTEPPSRFRVDTAAHWLRAQLERLESLDTVADDMEVLLERMAQAHALAPWREEMERMNGIECPRCHAYALAHFGGDEDVTCLRCREAIPPERYAIWVRMLTEQEGVG